METLVKQAQQEGIQHLQIALLVEKNGKILLLEPISFGLAKAYTFVHKEVLSSQTLQQAIQAASLQVLNLSVKQIKRFLTYKDSDPSTRVFYFIVEVFDPEDLKLSSHQSYGWVDPEESFGYPIQEQTREILDLYCKTR
jgi:hypothetical protein